MLGAKGREGQNSGIFGPKSPFSTGPKMTQDIGWQELMEIS